MENILAPLVYSQVQEQVPKLTKYMLGFELLDQKDDGEKCLGMIGFKINDLYYYMPVFYLNGFLKPLILLFDYQRKVFIPAIDEIIDEITSSSPGIGGEAVPLDKNRDAISLPNLYQFTLSPLLSKMGAILPHLKKNRDLNFDFDDLYNKFSSKVALLKVIRADKKLVEKFALLHSNLFNKDKEVVKKKASELIIKTTPDTTNTVEENMKLNQDDIVVYDNRKDLATVVTSGETDWENPKESGLYNVISLDKGIKKFYILCHPFKAVHVAETCILIDPESLEICEMSPLSLWVRKIGEIDRIRPKLISIKDLKSDKYILFRADLKYCTTPTSSYKIVINPKVTNTMDIFTDNQLVISQDTLALPADKTFTFLPGNLRDLDSIIYEAGYIDINVEKQGNYYNINNHEYSYKDAIIHLLNRNIGKNDVERMLKLGGSFLVKNATNIPMYESPFIYGETGILPMGQDRYRPEVALNPYVDPQNVQQSINQDISLAMNAMQTGENKIFDASLLGILAKNENNIERIKEAIPVIGKAIHALGLELFSIWWNSTDFTDDFTVDDLYDFEQTLLSTFKGLGKINYTIITKNKLKSQGLDYGSVQK